MTWVSLLESIVSWVSSSWSSLSNGEQIKLTKENRMFLDGRMLYLPRYTILCSSQGSPSYLEQSFNAWNIVAKSTMAQYKHQCVVSFVVLRLESNAHTQIRTIWRYGEKRKHTSRRGSYYEQHITADMRTPTWSISRQHLSQRSANYRRQAEKYYTSSILRADLVARNIIHSAPRAIQ